MELQREVRVIFKVLASSQKVKEHLLPVRKKRMLMTLVPGSSLIFCSCSGHVFLSCRLLILYQNLTRTYADATERSYFYVGIFRIKIFVKFFILYQAMCATVNFL